MLVPSVTVRHIEPGASCGGGAVRTVRPPMRTSALVPSGRSSVSGGSKGTSESVLRLPWIAAPLRRAVTATPPTWSPWPWVQTIAARSVAEAPSSASRAARVRNGRPQSRSSCVPPPETQSALPVEPDARTQ